MSEQSLENTANNKITTNYIATQNQTAAVLLHNTEQAQEFRNNTIITTYAFKYDHPLVSQSEHNHDATNNVIWQSGFHTHSHSLSQLVRSDSWLYFISAITLLVGSFDL